MMYLLRGSVEKEDESIASPGPSHNNNNAQGNDFSDGDGDAEQNVSWTPTEYVTPSLLPFFSFRTLTWG